VTGRITRHLRGALLATLGLGLAGTSLVILGSGPAFAVPDVPTNLTAQGAPIPTLSWDRVTGATSYLVQGSESPSFATPVFSQTTVNTSYVPVRVLKEGTLYWQVRAIDGSGPSAFATAQTTIDTHLPPTGLGIASSSPGSAILPPVAPPLITWNAVPGASGYDLEMDAEGDGVGGTVKTNLKTTSYVWPDPQGVGEQLGTENFFVRVRAKFDNNLQSDWSSYVSYDVTQLPAVTYDTAKHACPATVACAPDPVTGVRPSVDLEDVVLDWDPVKGAKQYEVWVALDPDFSNEVQRRIVSGTRYSPATTYDNKSYYWKVRAINAAGEPTPWPATPSVFRRRWAVAPTLVYPPSSTTPVTNDLYFQWTPVQHATRYSLEIGSDPNFTPNTFAVCSTASTTFTVGYRTDSCSPGPLRLNQGSIYYWRVRAYDSPSDVVSLYSTTSTVVYTVGRLTGLSPANGATVSVPTLRWGASTQTAQEAAATVKAAHTYFVWLVDKNGAAVESQTTSALSWTPTEALNPASSPYSWGVIAKDDTNKQSPTYPTRQFTYVAPSAGATPLAANPTDYGDSAARFPSLSWQPMAGASYYKLSVYNSAGFGLAASTTAVLNTQLANPAVTDWGTYFLSSPGTYTWGVTAYDSNDNAIGTTAFGDRGSFTIGTLPPVTGQRLALDGQALDNGSACTDRWDQSQPSLNVCGPVPSTPALDWDPVPGAGGYMVYLFQESDLTTPVYDPTVTATTNTRWTPDARVKQALAESTAGGAYYWFIRPCVKITPFLNCGPDPASLIDSATGAFQKVSPSVALTSPANASSFADEVTFSWQDYRTTNAASVYPAGSGVQSHQSGMTYRLQVARTATITDANVIDDEVVDQTTYTTYTDSYPEGDLWWRVQAIDAAGNRLAWSDTWKVTKATPAANLDPGFAAPNERPYVDDADNPSACAASYGDLLICKASPRFNAHVASGDFAIHWGAESFDSTWSIEVYKNDDTSASTANKVYAITTAKQAAYIHTAALAPSSEPYRWRIRRTDAYGRVGAWSDYGRFYVDPAPVTLLGPANGSAQPPNGPLLTWQPYGSGSAQAYRYGVTVRNGSGTFTSVSSTSATAWAPTVNFPAGTYTWVVTAYDASGNVLGTSPDDAAGGNPAWSFAVDTALVATTPTQVQSPDGAQVARTLTSAPPVWSQPGVVTTYQWLRAGANISGATGTTYTLTAADVGKAISLKATGKKAGYSDGTSISDPVTGNPGDAVVPTTMPTISGNPTYRETLTATAGGWPAGTTIGYQWFVNGVAVAKETKATYVVRSRDAGLPVFCRVTGSRTGYVSGTADSQALPVTRLSSTTTATVAKKRITQRERGVLTVKVVLVDFGVSLGQVQVKDGSKIIASPGLQTGKNGVLTVRLKRLKLGKHKLTVTYLGSTSTAPSSDKVTIKVVKGR
jgi:hypothetical protein